MKKLLVIALVSLMAASAFGQTLDPDSDMVGVYFDMGATSNTLDISTLTPGVPGNETFMAYVCITNPSASVLNGLEFGYTIAASAGYRSGAVLPAGAVDVGVSGNPLSGDYYIGFASPMPASASGSNVVVEWTWTVYNPFGTIAFTLHGPNTVHAIPGYDGPVYLGVDSIEVALGTSAGLTEGAYNVCAVAGNLEAPVAIESASFGSVKSLFR